MLAEPDYLELDKDVLSIARAYDAVVAIAPVETWTDDLKRCARFILVNNEVLAIGAASVLHKTCTMHQLYHTSYGAGCVLVYEVNCHRFRVVIHCAHDLDWFI